MTASPANDASPQSSRLAVLTLGAIGVVYGDIGTSPLYAIKECFSDHYGLQAGMTEVFGILSLIFWSLTIIICIKYLGLILRFDNKGEGGILALMELVYSKKAAAAVTPTLALGLFGATLLYGDGIITPAISVLSAVEGISVTAPQLQSLVIPITLSILVALFAIQRFGTGGVGKVFGPFMTFWFALLGVLGVLSILKTPEVLAAVNPVYAWDYFMHHGWTGFIVLGSVFLVVTGGETVYADMGHFGRTAITRGWFFLAYPALTLNYFGQGALLMREGHSDAVVANPFFHLVPDWAVIPLVVVATLSTIIASQAVISGAFSLTWQALQLGYFPRLKVAHTSQTERGQIYIPFMNWLLFGATAYLVLTFKSSSALAAAYGIAVTTTMVITSYFAFLAMRRVIHWAWPVALATTIVFLTIDLAFFSANIIKIPDGGWFPLAMGVFIFVTMITWRKGRQILGDAIRRRNLSLGDIISHQIDTYPIVEGTALYMSGYAGSAPPALVSNVKYNKCRHETIILLTVQVTAESHVPHEQRFEVMAMPKNFYQVILRYGFMDQLNLMDDLSYLPEYDIPVDITDATFILGNETLSVRDGKGMARWRKHVFKFLHRNSRTPVNFFGIPVKKVLEVGSHIEI